MNTHCRVATPGLPRLSALSLHPVVSTPQASKHSSKCSGQTPLLGHRGWSAVGSGKWAPDHSKHTGLGEGLKGVEQEAECKYKGQQREGKGSPSPAPTGPSQS